MPCVKQGRRNWPVIVQAPILLYKIKLLQDFILKTQNITVWQIEAWSTGEQFCSEPAGAWRLMSVRNWALKDDFSNLSTEKKHLFPPISQDRKAFMSDGNKLLQLMVQWRPHSFYFLKNSCMTKQWNAKHIQISCKISTLLFYGKPYKTQRISVGNEGWHGGILQSEVPVLWLPLKGS